MISSRSLKSKIIALGCFTLFNQNIWNNFLYTYLPKESDFHLNSHKTQQYTFKKSLLLCPTAVAFNAVS